MAIQVADRLQFQRLFDVVGAGAFNLNPAQYVDNESQVLQVTVPGAALGDFVLVAPGIDIAEVTFSAFVSAANTVDIVISMVGGDTDNIAAADWNVLVLRMNTAFARV